MNILYIESDLKSSLYTQYMLTWYKHNISLIGDLKNIYEMCMENRPELILIGADMLEINDKNTLREIRRYNHRLPVVLFVSPNKRSLLLSEIGNYVTDYIHQECTPEQLETRLQFALMKSKETFTMNQFTLSKNCTFDFLKREIKILGKTIKIPQMEALILQELCNHFGDVVEKKTLGKLCWNNDLYENYRHLDRYMVNIRKYLRKDPNVIIDTIRCSGYRLYTVGKV